MKVIDLTKESFTERVSDFRQYPDSWEFKGDKPCIVDFHAPWCIYARGYHRFLMNWLLNMPVRLTSIRWMWITSLF